MANIKQFTIKDKYSTDVTFTVNGEKISVSILKYLPAEAKMQAAAAALKTYTELNGANRYVNNALLEIVIGVSEVLNYTDIEVDENMSIFELYDIAHASGILANIEEIADEYDFHLCIRDTVENFYKYLNSAHGIMESISSDYENLNTDGAELQQNLANPENLTLLKDIVTKLG